MMTIAEDIFAEAHHDLEVGTCSRQCHEFAAQMGLWQAT
jgi:hypothetical protein